MRVGVTSRAKENERRCTVGTPWGSIGVCSLSQAVPGGEGWGILYRIPALPLVIIASPNSHHWAPSLCCVRSFSSVTFLNPPPLAWMLLLSHFTNEEIGPQHAGVITMQTQPADESPKLELGSMLKAVRGFHGLGISFWFYSSIRVHCPGGPEQGSEVMCW